jgi:hypothetical protein
MRRREFIAGLGTAATVLCRFIARAHQRAAPMIGYYSGTELVSRKVAVEWRGHVLEE